MADDEQRGPRDERNTAKLVLIAVLVIVLAAFVIANTDSVNVSFVFADIEVPLIFVLLVTAILGALIDRLIRIDGDVSGSYRAPDATADLERKRLQQMGALFDEPTISRLRRFGAQPGWHCLEIGAGSGSVARALAALVAPDGHVLATDVDDRFLEGEEHQLEFRVHDITRDPLPPDRFDLAHARGVLEHIRERERAVASMVGATKPGGFVVIEDPDWVVFDAQPLPDAFGALHRKLRDVYVSASGYDPNLGGRLPALLTAAGLVDVDAEGTVFTMRGSTPSMEWYVLGLERSLPMLVEAGVVDADLAATGLAEARDPECRLLSPLQMTAWGRKPR